MTLLDFAAAPESWGGAVSSAVTDVTKVFVDLTWAVCVSTWALPAGGWVVAWAGGEVVVEVALEVVEDSVVDSVPDVVELPLAVEDSDPEAEVVVEAELADSEAEVVAEAEVVDSADVVALPEESGIGAAPIGTGRPSGPVSWGARFLTMRLRLMCSRCWSGESWAASATVETAIRMAKPKRSVVESFRVLRASMLLVNIRFGLKSM